MEHMIPLFVCFIHTIRISLNRKSMAYGSVAPLYSVIISRDSTSPTADQQNCLKPMLLCFSNPFRDHCASGMAIMFTTQKAEENSMP
jgi:hypothetical protein